MTVTAGNSDCDSNQPSKVMNTHLVLRPLLLLFALLGLLTPVSSPAQGVPLPCCENFSSGMAGWTDIDLSILELRSPGPSGLAADNYLYAHDSSGASWTLGQLKCGGNWLEQMTSKCLKLTWDVQLFNDSNNNAVLAPLPRIFIFSTPTLGAYFTANVPGITEPGGPNPGWHNVCAPLGPLNVDGTLPSFPEGTWRMYNRLNPGSPPPDSEWPALLSAVTGVGFFADLTSAQKEEWGYDNICLAERECGCFKQLDPRVTCTQNAAGGFTFNYSFTLLNESGKIVNAVLVPPSLVTPPGVTVTPASQAVAISAGGSAPVNFQINGASGGQEVCFTIVLMNFVEGECCRDEVCLKLPCLKITAEHIDCVADPAAGGSFSWSPTVTNTTATVAGWAMFIPETPGTAMTPSLVNLGSLPPGGSVSLAPVSITGAVPASPFCFTIVVFDPARRTCCFQRHCITLPPCPVAGVVVNVPPNGTPAEPCKDNDPTLVSSPDGCIKLCHSRVLCDPLRTGCYTWTFDVTNGSTMTMTHLAVPLAGAVPQFITLSPPLAPGQAAHCSVTLCGASPGPLTVPLFLLDVKNCKCCNLQFPLTLPPCDCLQIVDEHIDCVLQANGTFCYRYTGTMQNLSGGTVSHLFLVPGVPLTATFSPSYFNIGPVPHGGTATFTTTICTTAGVSPLYFHITIHNDDFTVCCAIRHCVRPPSCCDCDRSWNFEGGAAGAAVQLPPGTTLLNLQQNAIGKIGFDPSGIVRPFPYVYMAASARATIVRIDANTGAILGEYRTAPQTQLGGVAWNTGSSRTTVDKYGECWVGNRWHSPIYGFGFTQGSVSRIGLIIGGTRWNKTGPGTYVASPTGEYLKGPFTYISPSVIDRDGDGYIRTSTGVGNYLNWDAAATTGNNAGGVSLADDECIVTYTRVVPTGVRALSLDRNNDLWVGGWPGVNTYQRVDGVTGAAGITIPLVGGYGCLIDGQNVLWSVNQGSTLERYDLTANVGLPSFPAVGIYGIGINPCDNSIWSSSYGQSYDLPWQAGAPTASWLRHWSPGPSGTWLGSYPQRAPAQGLCVDRTGTVWVSRVYNTPGVDRYTPTGTWVTTVLSGTNPINGATGCAVDHNGKIWVSDFADNMGVRIDPSTNLTDAAGVMNPVLPVLTPAQPYNYSDMTGFVALSATGQFGMMQFEHDSLCPNSDWGRLSWLTTGENGKDCRIVVEVRASNTPGNFTGPWYKATNSQWFCGKGIRGRYVQVRLSFYRPPGCPPQCDPRLCRLRLQCCDPNHPGDVNLPVDVEVASSVQAAVGGPVTLTAVLHDPEGQPVTARLSIGDGPALSLPVSADGIVSYNGAVFSAPGTIAAVLTASDGVNTTTGDITILVGDRTPPAMRAPAPLNIPAFSAVVPDFRAETAATDESGPVTLVQTPAPGTVVTQGTHIVSIRGTDTAGNSLTVTTWVAVLPVVSITSPANYAMFPQGAAVTVTFSTVGGVLPVSYELLENASVFPIPAGQNSLTINLSPGPHSLTLRARDAAGNTSLSVARLISVVGATSQPAPPAPLLQVTATDTKPGVPAITLSFDAPAGYICCVQKSLTLRDDWTTIHTLAGVGQHVDWTVEADPDVPRAFFRLVLINQ